MVPAGAHRLLSACLLVLLPMSASGGDGLAVTDDARSSSRSALCPHLSLRLELLQVEFFYTDKITISEDNVMPLMALARQLLVATGAQQAGRSWRLPGAAWRLDLHC